MALTCSNDDANNTRFKSHFWAAPVPGPSIPWATALALHPSEPPSYGAIMISIPPTATPTRDTDSLLPQSISTLAKL